MIEWTDTYTINALLALIALLILAYGLLYRRSFTLTDMRAAYETGRSWGRLPSRPQDPILEVYMYGHRIGDNAKRQPNN